MRTGAERKILPPQTRHLGQAQTRLEGHQQEGVVAATTPGEWVRRCQEGIDLRPSQEAYQSASLPLIGDGQHPLDLAGVCRLLVGCVTEKGTDGCQA
jgi:hypothetical protein